MRRLITFGCLLLVTAGAADEDTGPRFFRPLDKTAVKPGPLSIVARGSAEAVVALDGRPMPVDRPGPNALSATVRLAAGRHELILKDGTTEQKIELFAGDGEPPAGFAAFRTHPPAAACDACHAVNNGAWGFKGLLLSESCLGCHEAARFPESHQHTPDTLPDCQLCHRPHGAAAAKLLKLKKDVACKQCHG